MSRPTYLRYELLRTVRNWRFMLFSLVFPLVLFLTVAGSNRRSTLDGIPFPLYYMAGMAAWGAMMAVMSAGARIAGERQAGWTRQIRITPLTTRAYFRAKVLGAYMLALASMGLLYGAGLVIGVHLDPAGWARMTLLILVGLVPFTVMGILLGHVLTPDSMGPALGGITSLLALLGGAWGPLVSHGIVLSLARLVPSYWLVQAGQSAMPGHSWPTEAWMVLAVWAVVMARLARIAYRRDTSRVTA